jgi:hypothetical protein
LNGVSFIPLQCAIVLCVLSKQTQYNAEHHSFKQRKPICCPGRIATIFIERSGAFFLT